MNKQEILKYVGQKYKTKSPPPFRVGDTVRVHVKIKEGNTVRVQVFEGTVIGFKGTAEAQTFTIRKISFGVGVERVFPLFSPTIEKIQVVRSGHARRAKLYYLRSRVGKAARLEEKAQSGPAPKEKAVPETTAEPESEGKLVSTKEKQ